MSLNRLAARVVASIALVAPICAWSQLTIEPITWDVVGLDSNRPNSGPRDFPVGARVCSPTASAGIVDVDLVLNVPTPPPATFPITALDATRLTYDSIPAGTCVDAYFTIRIDNVAASYFGSRPYSVRATPRSGGAPVSTPTASPQGPRQLYIEKLVSQNRNSINSIAFGPVGGTLTAVPSGGTMRLVEGQTYNIRLNASTATNGYEQLEAFLTLPNNIYRISKVQTTYSANSTGGRILQPHDRLYGDACLWNPVVGTPTYLSCATAGKVGGTLSVLYELQVVGGSGGGTQPLQALIYDFSGSSYHYNSDFGSFVVNVSITAETDLAITKSKSGAGTATPGGALSYSLLVQNLGPSAANGAILKDPSVANFTAGSITCGSATGGAVCPSAPLSLANLQGANGIVIPTLPSGGSLTFTLTGTAANALGSITNTATIDPPAGTTDTNTANNTSSVTTPINAVDLSVTKTGPASVSSNGSVSYSIVVANAAGGVAADGAILKDAAVANFTATSITCGSATNGAVCPQGANELSVARLQGNTGVVIPVLPAGSSLTFTLAGTASATGSIANTATIAVPSAGGIGDVNTANNTSTANTAINPAADLSVTKTGPASVNASGAVSYSIVVANAGPAAANGAIVTDAQVANFTATTLTCGSTTGSAVCPTSPTVAQLQAGLAIPTLPSGGSVTFTLSGTAGASGTITNIATVATPAGVTDPTPGNNSSTASTTINVPTTADLSVTKTGTVSVAPSGAVSYTIVVSNAGPAAANGAIVTDAAVANFSASAVACGSASGGAACPASPTVAQIQAGLAIPTLPSGGSVTFTLSGTAGASGSITNVATVAPPSGITDPTGGNNTSSANTSITPTPPTTADLSVIKTGPASVATGGAVTFTIVVSNAGPAAANGATLSDPSVANFTASSVSCGTAAGGAVCPSSPTVAQLQAGLAIPTLPSGGSVTFTLSGTAAASGSIANVATVAPPSGITDPTPGNNSSTANVTINPPNTADLSVTKTGPATVNANGAVSFTIVVSNAGPAAANGATVTDPSVSNFTATTLSCGSASGGAVCPATPTVAQIQAGLAIPTLPSGGSVTFTLSGTAGASGSIANVATVAPPSGVTDPTPGNNSSTANTTISPPNSADLSVAKSGPAAVAPSGAVTYVIVVSNAGPAAANGATLSDPSVANFTASSVSCGTAAGGAVCPSSPTVAQLQAGLAIPTLPSGGSLTFTLSGTSGGSGSIANVATVAPPGGITDPTPGNNTSTANTTITSNPPTTADLSVTKTGPATVAPGGNVTYTIVIANAGPAAANGATLTDASVANFNATTVTCGSATGGAVCPASPTVGQLQSGLTISTFPSGGSLTFSLSGTAGASGSIANTASIFPPTGISDPVFGNNTSLVTTAIAVPTTADLSATKTGPASIAAGGAVTFTIVVSNAGPAAANGATISDPVVANFTATSLTCGSATGGAACPGSPTVAQLQAGLAIPTLPSGGAVTFTLTGTAGASGSISNVATVAPPPGVTDPTPGNNSGTATTSITPGNNADLSVVKTGPATVTPGGAVTYTIVVANAGPAAANGSTLTDASVANFTGTTVTCGSASGGAVCPASPTVAQLQSGLTIATFPNGGSLTFTLSGTAGASGSIANTASIFPPTGTTDPALGNNSSLVTTAIVANTANLSVTKTGPASTFPNGAVSYTIVVANAGPAAANGAVVTDAAVANFTATALACGSASGGAVCPPSPTVAQLQSGLVISTLPSGGSVTFTLSGTAGISGAISNVATVAPPAGITDPNPGNNTSFVSTTINPLATGSADLSIVKTGPAVVQAGGAVTYELVIRNAGPNAADRAIVQDEEVANFTATSVTCGSTAGGAVCPSSPTVTQLQDGLLIPTLPAGGSLVITLRGTAVAAPVAALYEFGGVPTTSIVNVGSVVPPPGVTDPIPGNNVSGFTTQVEGGPTGGTISGYVWYDNNGNRVKDPNEPGRANWKVQLLNEDFQVVATTVSAPDGFYNFSGLPPGSYSVRFTPFGDVPGAGAVNGDPSGNGGTPSGTVLSGITLTQSGTVINQSLPLDPSGVVYGSLNRQPVAGAQVTLLFNGAPADPNFIAGGSNVDTTALGGQYAFFLLPGAPAGTWGLSVGPTANYGGSPSSIIPPSTPPAGYQGGSVGTAGAPPSGANTTYYLSFPLPTIDIINNNIPVDPVSTPPQAIPTLSPGLLALMGLLLAAAGGLVGARRRREG